MNRRDLLKFLGIGAVAAPKLVEATKVKSLEYITIPNVQVVVPKLGKIEGPCYDPIPYGDGVIVECDLIDITSVDSPHGFREYLPGPYRIRKA